MCVRLCTITSGPSKINDARPIGTGTTRLPHTTSESGFGVTKADILTDFTSGQDLIDLSLIDADTSILGDQAFTFIGNAAFTGLGQLRVGVDSTGHAAIFANTTGSLTADFQVSLHNNAALTAVDFLL
mgnify:CR=1 FL=1